VREKNERIDDDDDEEKEEDNELPRPPSSSLRSFRGGSRKREVRESERGRVGQRGRQGEEVQSETPKFEI